jgi:hypothetical protein
MVNYPCVVGTDIMNLILQEQVDLLFQAHDHAYARSRQLALNPTSCPSLPPTSYDPDCVADAGSTSYTKGAGTIVTTVGTGGKNMNSENSPPVPQEQYFVPTAWQGTNRNATWGFTKVNVSPTELSASFVRGSGGTFTDTYTVTNSTPVTTSPPTTTAPPGATTTLTPVADTWVGSDATSTTHGSETALYSVTGTPTKVTYLKFDLTGVTGTLTSAGLTVTTTTGTSSGSPSAQDVYSVADTSWAEAAMTYATAPPLGAKLVSIPGGSAPNTAYTVTLPGSALQPAVGGQLTLAIKGAAADAFYVNSKEAATGRPQLALTTG